LAFHALKNKAKKKTILKATFDLPYTTKQTERLPSVTSVSDAYKDYCSVTNNIISHYLQSQLLKIYKEILKSVSQTCYI